MSNVHTFIRRDILLVMKPDHYRDFKELSENEREGVDYQIRSHRRASGIAVIAPHGGKIEPGTAEIAEAIAAEHFSFYAFEGVKRAHNNHLLLSGERFDEPQCRELLADAKLVLGVYGTGGGQAAFVSIGGTNGGLVAQLHEALQSAGFEARVGEDPAHHDAELTISKALREALKDGTTALDQFAAAVRAVLDQHAKSTPPLA